MSQANETSESTTAQLKSIARSTARWTIPAAVMDHIRRFATRTRKPTPTPDEIEIQRLEKIPNDVPGIANLGGETFHFTDAYTFLWEHQQIFKNKCYDFPCNDESPVIIDCGANIGMAARYWLSKFPQANVIAFEPDPQIFAVLQKNMQPYQSARIQLYNAALWNSETRLEFRVTGSESGHLAHSQREQSGETVSVKTLRLSPFLDRKVDFLKIDIEGSEVDVIVEAHEKLRNVKSLWLEYHSLLHVPQRLSKILSVLEQQGFRYHLVTESVSERPLQKLEASYGMDQRLNIWAYQGDQFPMTHEREQHDRPTSALEDS